MKYLGILAFLVALIWTRTLLTNADGIDLETHTSIQEQIVGMITQAVAESRPDGFEVQFDNIWTEPLSPTRLRASYKYHILSAHEDGSRNSETVSGTALLNLTNDGYWSVDQVKTTNKEIVFQTGVVIRPIAQ